MDLIAGQGCVITVSEESGNVAGQGSNGKCRLSDEIIQVIAGGIAQQHLERNYAKWHHGYFVKPYWYARTPGSPLYPMLKDDIERSLDFDIATQEADGSAHLTFRVEGEARDIWRSVWTLESLRILKAYGRIEGEPAW